MKVGMNLTVLEEADGMWILGDDEGHKYHLPVPFTGEASDLGGLISDIEAENDDYARTVIPLIQRMLADDYAGTGLFEAIDRALRLVEPAISLDPEARAQHAKERQEQADMAAPVVEVCGHVYSPEAICSRPPGHVGDHSCEVADIDPETRLHLGRRTAKWPNV